MGLRKYTLMLSKETRQNYYYVQWDLKKFKYLHLNQIKSWMDEKQWLFVLMHYNQTRLLGTKLKKTIKIWDKKIGGGKISIFIQNKMNWNFFHFV